MARTKGNGKQPAAKTAAPAGAGKNELTDEDRQNLFFHHRRAYDAKSAALEAAKADFKKVCNLAKGELGKNAVRDIKASIELESEGGEAKIKERIEAEFRIARWMAVPLGAQTDLFTDRTPAVDRATAEGLRDGKLGNDRNNTYTKGSPQWAAYDDAYRDGQSAIAKWGKARDAAAFDQTDDERRRELAGQKPDFGGEGAEAH